MKVNMIGWEFPPFVSGGLGVHCFELVTRMSKKGVQVTFFMPKTKHKVAVENVDIVEVGKRKKSSLRIVEVGVTNLNPYISPYGAPSGVKFGSGKDVVPIEAADFFDAVSKYNEAVVSEALKRDCDLIHCHDWITFRAGVRLKELTGKPLVVTVHSTEYDRTGNIYPWQWILDIEKEGMEKADRVIAVSNHTKNLIVEKFGINPDKIDVVYNGIDYTRFASSPGRELIDTKDRIVLFLGRLTNQKGPRYFLEAAKKVLKKVKDVKFVIAGKGQLMPELIHHAIDLGIADKVVFTGYVPDEDLIHLYAISDCYILPSVSEPFGITVLEAMASGVPTIISKSSGVSEIAKNCLKVDFWDTDKMAELIGGILKYPVLRRYIGERARKESMLHTWEKTVKGTVEVYRRAVSR